MAFFKENLEFRFKILTLMFSQICKVSLLCHGQFLHIWSVLFWISTELTFKIQQTWHWKVPSLGSWLMARKRSLSLSENQQHLAENTWHARLG